jgi:hypothetical protein
MEVSDGNEETCLIWCLGIAIDSITLLVTMEIFRSLQILA